MGGVGSPRNSYSEVLSLLRTVTATRYVTPLREGVRCRRSSRLTISGPTSSNSVVLDRAVRRWWPSSWRDSPPPRPLVPEVVLVNPPELGRSEPDPEIQDLLNRSTGPNLALDYLPGSSASTRSWAAGFHLASRIVWFDALVTNVDRTPRNTNLLVWHDRLWLIDHGASLYFHHNWPARDGTARDRKRRPFAAIRDHVLLLFAGSISEADAALAPRLTPGCSALS